MHLGNLHRLQHHLPGHGFRLDLKQRRLPLGQRSLQLGPDLGAADIHHGLLLGEHLKHHSPHNLPNLELQGFGIGHLRITDYTAEQLADIQGCPLLPP
ncbi:hypothetical protein D3C76_1640480 [compost metagenome]